MLGLINEGCIPMPFAEGLYNNRLNQHDKIPQIATIFGFSLFEKYL
jgi:hypothetical protein